MMRRRGKLLIALGATTAIVGAVAAWVMLPPGPMAFAGGDAVALADYTGPSPVGVPPALRSQSLVERGKYLAQAADCQACHTGPSGQAFAGGRAFTTGFGTLYSPNITPDPETGIGSWSDADFLRAVHKGIAKNGWPLYPAFPYESYTLLTDDDVLAIKAYLFSLPPVHAPPPPDALIFPFNQRWLMFFWGAFYDRDSRFHPRQDRSPEWNRGAYLVEALAHCGDCHTPRNLGQAPDNRAKFAGSPVDGWWAYNITQDAASGIGGWGDAAIAAYLRGGHAAGHGSAGGPMAEAVDVSLSKLDPEDVHAMVVYLRTIPAIHIKDLPAPKAAPASESPRTMQLAFDMHGMQIFEGACASCHGWSGESPVAPTATLIGARSVNDVTGFNVAEAILGGVTRPAPLLSMPAFAAAYSDDEIAAVANYVTARFGAKGSALTGKQVAALRNGP